ncbi:MAG: 4-alpha-glucanotransferase [Spirochaetota bacterium]
MKFPYRNHYMTGVAVPVGALRSRNSIGTGEFLDLIPFGEWCRRVGLDTIQILPVNDTGFQSSPYLALSAHALHPLFIRISRLPESQGFGRDIETLKRRYESYARIRYNEVLSDKLGLIRKIYDQNKNAIGDAIFKAWIKENEWVIAYAVFCCLKETNRLVHWKAWPEMQNPKTKDIDRYWEQNGESCLFFAWLQFHLEKQLKQAAAELSQMGLVLKGDLPILMSEDSVDVWYLRKYFQENLRAGAPPDFYSEHGQNWGFPIYDWSALKKEDYSWWKLRLKQADKFYHAYRIDHVLGFFRIWSVPEQTLSAGMGYYVPFMYLTERQLSDLGFDEGRIKWLSEPHIYTHEIREQLGDDAGRIINTYLNRIGNEELFLFQPEIQTEKNIYSLDESTRVKNVLLAWSRNRALIEIKPGLYFPAWHYRNSRAYNTLSETERSGFEELIFRLYTESEKKWQALGTRLLSFMKAATEMLVCAEDLGVVPACVPKVLKKLHILSLKVIRWAKDYSRKESPFIRLKKYPFLSVCAASIHDTSTLRGWWESETDEKEKAAFCTALGMRRKESAVYASKAYSEETAEKIIHLILGTGSGLAVFQIQDLFALDNSLLPDDPVEERINIPGMISEKNWTYRIPVTVEALMDNSKLNNTLSNLVKERKFKTAQWE